MSSGNETITHDSETGFVTGTALGDLTTTIDYDDDTNELNIGEIDSIDAYYNSNLLFEESFDLRDNLGRITEVTEKIGLDTTTRKYEYDDAGRITTVLDGSDNEIETFTYDANGNRLSYWKSGLIDAIPATYDNQDRIKTYGSNSYTFTQNGSLSSKTNGSDVTTYEYDEFGSLRSVILPDDTEIEYVIDPAGRRIGKKVDETLVQGFLYEGIRPVVELDEDGDVVSRFVYGTRANVPDFMIQAGVTYRIITDIRGSVRLVVNTSTGTIVQQIDYDTFGNILSDTSPGFQPFGFAGGLYDPDTNLVRFGARDYDPEIGRWTSKDPILFEGGDTNLYVYCGNDPVNYVDPEGLYINDQDLSQESIYIIENYIFTDPQANEIWFSLMGRDDIMINIISLEGMPSPDRYASSGPINICNNNNVWNTRYSIYHKDFSSIGDSAALLYHELNHYYYGWDSFYPDSRIVSHEEYFTLYEENMYRDRIGIPRRKGL